MLKRMQVNSLGTYEHAKLPIIQSLKSYKREKCLDAVILVKLNDYRMKTMILKIP